MTTIRLTGLQERVYDDATSSRSSPFIPGLAFSPYSCFLRLLFYNGNVADSALHRHSCNWRRYGRRGSGGTACRNAATGRCCSSRPGPTTVAIARRAGGRASLLDGRVLASTHDWSFTSAAANGKPGHALQRAKVIGGCSAHNGCIVIWGSRADYDGWAAAGNDGWSTAEVVPYFERAAARLCVRDFAPEEVTPLHGACLEAMIGSGIPQSADLNDLDEDTGAALAPINIRNGVRWSTALAYLDPVRNRRELTIVGDTLVDRINLRGSRAASVDFIREGERMTVEAGAIYLCAGTYGSPAILLRSGIGPAEELQKTGIITKIDLPGVGRNLHDHPGVSMTHYGTPLFDSLMTDCIAAGKTVFTEQSLAKARSSRCKEAFDLHIAPLTAAGPDGDGRWECSMYVANMAPRSRGRLTLRDSDPRSNPVIDTGYFTDPGDNDLAVLMDGVALTREIARQPQLAELIGPRA